MTQPLFDLEPDLQSNDSSTDKAKLELNAIVDRLRQLIITIFTEADHCALIYCFGMFFLFAILCLLMKHHEWIFSIPFGNIFGDFNAETPRMLSGLLTKSQDNSQFWSIIFSSLPAAVQFNYLDDFFSFLVQQDFNYKKYIHIYRENFSTKIFMFFGSYFLMSIISLAWTPPVTFNLLLHSKIAWLIVLVWAVFAIGVVVTEDFDYFTSIRDFSLTIFFKLGIELVKTILLTLAFGLIASMQKEGRDWSSFVNIIISIFLSLGPVCFIIANKVLGPFVSLMAEYMIEGSAEDFLGYTDTAAGEMFCFVVVVVSVVGALALHFFSF